MYFLCPSAKIVSKAKEVFPEPETPEITTNLFRGIFKLIFCKLFTLAFFISINFGSVIIFFDF